MHIINIENLIPHRGRMKLISSGIEISNTHAVTLSTVTTAWPLLNGDVANPIVLIEVVAQTAAVLFCWKKGEQRTAYSAGVLTGIKKADFFVEAIPLGADLITSVTNLYSLEDYEAMEGKVMMGNKCLCIIQLQIFGFQDKGESY